MIGSIPSYTTDQGYSLSDEQLFPPHFHDAIMYTNNNAQSNTYPGHHSQFVPRAPEEQSRSSYPPPPAQNYSSFNNSNVYAEPGSFSAVGAAYGFNPDQPIQIPPHHIPPSQPPMLPGYNSDYSQAVPPPHPHSHQHQHQFSLPMHNPPYQAPNPDWNPAHSIKRQRYGEDSDDEDPHSEITKRRPLVLSCSPFLLSFFPSQTRVMLLVKELACTARHLK